ncbi:hypothetical protein HRbin36_00056 [bacterium HR36]|nr:hypothetical protein HRbin36_00056 [bacterium HR36]
MHELEQTCREFRKQHNHLDATKPKLQHLVSEILQHEEERDQLVYQSFYPEPSALD